MKKPNLVARKVYFYTLDGSRLAGTLTLPAKASATSRTPAVLLCQGLSGVKNLVLPEIAMRMAQAGLASLAFDYRGYGESEGKHGWINPASRVDDALHAFAFLAQCKEVDPKCLGVYGLSLGGPVALSVAASEPRARAVVTVSAPGNGEEMLRSLRTSSEWIEFKNRLRADRDSRAVTGKSALVSIQEIFPFSPNFMAKYSALKSGGTSTMARQTGPKEKSLFYLASGDAIIDFRPKEAAERLGNRPLLMVVGEEDDIATVKETQKIYRTVSGPKKLIVVPGYDHVDLDTGHGLEYQARQAIRWFNEHLATIQT